MGTAPVSEAKLRRIAEAVGVAWPLVAHLRRFFATLLPAVERRKRMAELEARCNA